MLGVRQVEPIGCVVRVDIQLEVNEIPDAIIGFETVDFTIAPYFIRRVDVDAVNSGFMLSQQYHNNAILLLVASVALPRQRFR